MQTDKTQLGWPVTTTAYVEAISARGRRAQLFHPDKGFLKCHATKRDWPIAKGAHGPQYTLPAMVEEGDAVRVVLVTDHGTYRLAGPDES